MMEVDVRRNGFRRALAGVVLAAFTAPTALAANGVYLGVAVAGAFYDATYDKTVFARVSNVWFPGQRLHSADSSEGITYDAGLLIGYRGSLGVLSYGVEGDWTTHRGTVTGRLVGEIGNYWPLEDWELAKDESYGLTLRVGRELPSLRTTAYMLVGTRRVQANVAKSYLGCPFPGQVCIPNLIKTHSEFFAENFNAVSVGAGIERPFANFVVRAELRYVGHGSADRLALFDRSGVSVPTRLEASEIGLGVSLLWTF